MRTKKTEIDVLWLVEHVARELDVACVVKALAESRYGVGITIRNIYYHAKEVLRNFKPRVVVHPFFYFMKGALATEDFVGAWPNSTHFNLAWEQIHYKAHLKIKAPSDDFTKHKVIHHAWGDFYKDYLISNGVDIQNIFVNGQPAYQLYKAPYREFFKKREQLSKLYGLNPNDRWIFVPENYRWAFIGNKIKQFKALGGDEREIQVLSEFCTHSLKILLEWCNRVGFEDGITLIFRPRPAVNSNIMKDFCQENVGPPAPNLHFIKNESVRDWIMASDLVMSSYSTSLIEAAVAEKPIYMIEPLPFPEGLYCDWYDHAPRIATGSDFEKACYNNSPAADIRLKSWAEKNLLAYGDPIERLAGFIQQLVERHRQSGISSATSHEIKGLEDKKYFNPLTHENDVFEDNHIEQLISAWRQTMRLEIPVNSTKQPTVVETNEADIINKTMSRKDLLSKEAAPVVESLNDLIRKMNRMNLSMSSWVGSLPSQQPGSIGLWKRLCKAFRTSAQPLSLGGLTDPQEGKALERGLEQRLDYQPLTDAADDIRFPWFLYWEIFWVLKVTRRFLNPGARILDGGGSASLFTCYMASLGYEVHCVELNQKLNAQSRLIADGMKYKLIPYDMDLRKLDFPDGYFDHAFSICVFEHLDYEIKQAALEEIARCLKPGGIFSITFDYRNPAPGIVGYGKDTRPKNQLKTEDDIRRSFLGCDRFELMGNRQFFDNDESYLLHRRFDNAPYTFGAIFLQKKS